MAKDISPFIPKDPLELTELKEDLLRMGCLCLLDFCWDFGVKSTVQEIRHDPLPEPEGDSIRACPERWTVSRWQEVYNFPRQGAGWTSLKKEEYAKGRFSTKDAKNGYAVQDCLDSRAKRVFSFLVPILHPEKPTRVTVTLANTLYGSYLGERMVNWAIIVKDVVIRLTKSVNGIKRSPLCPFLIHLYHHFKETTPEEDMAYETQLMMKKFEGTESEAEPASEGGSSSSQSEEEALPPPKRQRQKQGGAPSTRTRAAARAAATGPAQLGGKTYRASELIEALRVYVDDVERTLGHVSSLVGNPPCQGLLAAVKEKIGGASDLRLMEQKVNRLTLDMTKMKSRALEAEKSCKEALLQANASAAALQQVEEALHLPAEVVMKAKMFDARLDRDDHISSKRVIAFMIEQTVKVEAAYANMRMLVGNLTHILPKVVEDSDSSDEDADFGSETDSREHGSGDPDPLAEKDVVDLDSPDPPSRTPYLGVPARQSPSEITTQVQHGGNEGSGVTRELPPTTLLRQPPLEGAVHLTSVIAPSQGMSHLGKTTSEGSPYLYLPVQSEDKSGRTFWQDVIMGAPSQGPALPARFEPHPSTTPMPLTPGGPDVSLTSRETLLRSSTERPVSTMPADLLSPLVALATAASNPTSSRSSKKRRRKEEKRRLEKLARK